MVKSAAAFLVLVISLGSGFMDGLCGGVPVAPFASPARAESQAPDRPVDKLTVVRPVWHRGAGLLFGEVTIRNRNPYPVTHVIIMCDLFDEWGSSIGSKGTALRRPIPPGSTRIGGIEFPITVRNMQGGACRVLSAERLEASNHDDAS